MFGSTSGQLGARHFPTDDAGNLIKGDARHPSSKTMVVIYRRRTIRPGRITYRAVSTIGGNCPGLQELPRRV